jgi:hypothetical protein
VHSRQSRPTPRSSVTSDHPAGSDPSQSEGAPQREQFSELTRPS